MTTSNRAGPTTTGKFTQFSNTKNTRRVEGIKGSARSDGADEDRPSDNPAQPDGHQSSELLQSHTPEDSPVRVRVQRYLDTFCQAMLEGDTKALASLWSVPALVVDKQAIRLIQSGAQVERFFAGSSDVYRARGIVDTRAEIQSLDVVADNLAIVSVRWPYINEAGQEIGEESSTYTLRANDDGDFQLCVCTMRGEVSQETEHH